MTDGATTAGHPVEPTWPELLTSLLQGRDLTSAQTAWATGDLVVTGDMRQAQSLRSLLGI